MEIHSAIVAGESLNLYPQKAVYWPREKMLLIADLHLGKSGHFRKAGIGIPNIQSSNLNELGKIIDYSNASQIIFLGDLFHSRMSQPALIPYIDFFNQYPNKKLILITGNHDLLAQDAYQQMQLHQFDQLDIPPFNLSHEPNPSDKLYNLSGHIHPSVTLKGKGRQRLRLPCFFFAQKSGILPAFGAFTGTFNISAKKGDQVFVVSGKEVIRVGP